MVLVDVNLLLQGVMTGASDHARVNPWLEARLRGPDRVGLPWAVLTGFVRVAGQRSAWEVPLTTVQALGHVREWLSRPNVWVPEPGPQHLERLELLLGRVTEARLTPDAHLAAIALEHGLEVCSHDSDFALWNSQGVRWHDPLS